MKKGIRNLKKYFVESICLFVGMVALIKTAIGFRPREIKEFVTLWIEPYGIALLLNLLVFTLLLPAAFKIKKKLNLELITTAIFFEWSVLLIIDFMSETIFNMHYSTVWLLRIVIVVSTYWAHSEYKEILNFLKLKLAKMKNGNFWLFIYTVILLIFLLREFHHFYFTRPNQAFGDEISWWFTGAKEFMNVGLAEGIKNHWYGDYTPAIPWLISLAPKLFGIHQEVFLFGFAPIAAFILLFSIFETALNVYTLSAVLSVLLLTFTICRDFTFHFVASLYGESLIASLLFIVFTEVYALLNIKKNIPNLYLLFISIVIGFFRLTKPPLSILCWYAALGCAGYFLVINFKKNLNKIILLLLPAFSIFMLWKNYLHNVNKSPTYKVQFQDFVKSGIDIQVPLGMIKGLLNYATFQSAYTWGLIVSLIVTVLLKSWNVLKLQLVFIFLYWGFVFGLYATVWNKGELNSAGRYLSHMAVAIIASLTIALNVKHSRYSSK